MKHYEIVILVHPDQSEQATEMVGRYRKMIEDGGGAVHREEDWGMRRLQYTIQKTHKARYWLLNIECNDEVLDELKSGFRFNDAVIRYMVIRRDEAITEDSPILKSKRKSDAEEKEREEMLNAAKAHEAEAAAAAQASELAGDESAESAEAKPDEASAESDKAAGDNADKAAEEDAKEDAKEAAEKDGKGDDK